MNSKVALPRRISFRVLAVVSSLALVLGLIVSVQAGQASASTTRDLYWTNHGTDLFEGIPAQTGIGKVSTSNSSNIDATANATAVNPTGIAVTATTLYWSEGTEAAPFVASKIYSAPLTDTNNATLLVDESDKNVAAVAVDDSNIYWTVALSGTNSKIKKASLEDPSEAIDLVTGIQQASGLALSGNKLYWTDTGRSKIGQVNVGDTSTANPDFVTGIFMPIGIAVNDTHVYWTEPFSSGVGRATIADTSDADGHWLNGVVADEYPSAAIGIAIDDTYLYWANWFEAGTCLNPSADPVHCNGSGPKPGNRIGRAKLDGSGSDGTQEWVYPGATGPFNLAITPPQNQPEPSPTPTPTPSPSPTPKPDPINDNCSGNSCAGADLSGADLRNARTKSPSTRGEVGSKRRYVVPSRYSASFRSTNLSRANLSGAYLRNSDLTRANLSRSSLARTNLRHSNLAKANLGRANVKRANLMYANLKGAKLTKVNLRQAKIRGIYR
ncbi:MAG: pentapeptide repeat-containing protein [Candidatus Nanopelagicales bacterium]